MTLERQPEPSATAWPGGASDLDSRLGATSHPSARSGVDTRHSGQLMVGVMVEPPRIACLRAAAW